MLTIAPYDFNIRDLAHNDVPQQIKNGTRTHYDYFDDFCGSFLDL